jgi:signal transduction histidine kinase
MKNMLEVLHSFPDLAEVPDEQLQWLIDNSELRHFDTGDLVFKKGDPIDNLVVVLDGYFEYKVERNNQFRSVGEARSGEITGLLPYSRAKIAAAFAECKESGDALFLHRDKIREMIQNHDELTTALVHVMSTRIRSFTKRQQQDDKMVSLGKLSAGLAHELNNPSAAVVRSARELKKHLGLLPGGFKKVIKIEASDQAVDRVNDVLFARIEGAETNTLSMMERSSLEDELLDWLEDHEVQGADEMAEVFAEFNFSVDELDEFEEILRKEDLEPVLNWLSQVLNTEKLVNEIEEASKRINDLVSSIKGYTHMDKAPEKQATDIHKGIRDTLTMLNFKLRKGGVNIVEDFDDTLPQPPVHVSEMNQVWTNLIDNAIDAMEDSSSKELKISTYQKGDFVNIDIRDTGSGISEEDIDHIFDPFFTTKPIGKGTGLGLDVVNQIVTQHNGRITVNSKPGETTFNVCIPAKQ